MKKIFYWLLIGLFMLGFVLQGGMSGSGLALDAAAYAGGGAAFPYLVYWVVKRLGKTSERTNLLIGCAAAAACIVQLVVKAAA